MLSSFSEECSIENKDSACYYSIDITPDMDYKHLFFFVPESEDIYISIQEFNYGYIEKPDSDINSYISSLTTPFVKMPIMIANPVYFDKSLGVVNVLLSVND